MEVIFMLVGFSLMVALLFLGLFFWAVRDGQYDDGHTPAMRILFDKNKDNTKEQSKTTNTKNNTD
ncbi:cbb3-type cytochrome oxidase assembly protein CcoS [Fodinibius halophilus]|uniref:Cbb3-type cytochrome oxidase assembly protein CcoS n=1 Tax=Fodinibius halophilus TaxID=1736908 RepID=A0A6M1TF57_9BACT|nr:cbb3-type cytochrome oxidase assembly protein CcoS [Fodinibius halophilus]NGP88802.1 cbb3-type cytochrome oxidase assembly protein CcoS [Fodinibius halophilus]